MGIPRNMIILPYIYISYTTIYYPFNGYVCAHPRAVLKLSHKPILLTNPANIAANPSSWEWRNIHLIWRKEIELFTASSRYNRVWNSQHWHPNASCSSHTPNSQEVGTKIPRPQMWRLEIRNESICLFVLASQGLLSSLCPSNKFIVVDRTLAWSWSWIEATGCRQCVVEVVEVEVRVKATLFFSEEWIEGMPWHQSWRTRHISGLDWKCMLKSHHMQSMYIEFIQFTNACKIMKVISTRSSQGRKFQKRKTYIAKETMCLYVYIYRSYRMCADHCVLKNGLSTWPLRISFSCLLLLVTSLSRGISFCSLFCLFSSPSLHISIHLLPLTSPFHVGSFDRTEQPVDCKGTKTRARKYFHSHFDAASRLLRANTGLQSTRQAAPGRSFSYICDLQAWLQNTLELQLQANVAEPLKPQVHCATDARMIGAFFSVAQKTLPIHLPEVRFLLQNVLFRTSTFFEKCNSRETSFKKFKLKSWQSIFCAKLGDVVKVSCEIVWWPVVKVRCQIVSWPVVKVSCEIVVCGDCECPKHHIFLVNSLWSCMPMYAYCISQMIYPCLRIILNCGTIVVGVHLTKDFADLGDRNVFVDPLQDTLQFGNGDPDGERAWRSSTSSLKQHNIYILW